MHARVGRAQADWTRRLEQIATSADDADVRDTARRLLGEADEAG
jgi:hypothetical protein